VARRDLLIHSVLAYQQRPLLKAVLLRDMDVLGRLVRRKQAGPAGAPLHSGFIGYLAQLREHGWIPDRPEPGRAGERGERLVLRVLRHDPGAARRVHPGRRDGRAAAGRRGVPGGRQVPRRVDVLGEESTR
jgi:hypothetical protein